MFLDIFKPFLVMKFTKNILPFFVILNWFMFCIGLYLSTCVIPSDFQQGEHSKIICVHVPAAWLSLITYAAITITSIWYLVSNHPIWHLFTQIGSKIGILFTIITLITGCFWGKPMWGVFWVWDARLTSVLILLFIYLGILRFNQISAEIASIFICLGFVNIPIIKFSVNWWNTLHQPSSLSQFGTSVHLSMLIPILIVFVSLIFISVLIVCFELRWCILKAATSTVVVSPNTGVFFR